MWEKIKRILSKEGGKIVIIEDNQPAYIITKWEDLETEQVNRSIDHWKAEENLDKEPEVNEVNQEIEAKEEVKIEDLPF